MRTLLIIITTVFLAGVPVSVQSQKFDIPVFAYHRFGDDRFPSTNISMEVFESQLEYLKENDYRVLSMGEAVDRWTSGDDFPEKTVVLTVDDGYLSFYTHGVKLLKKYGYPATVFVQTQTVGGNDFMNWNQLKELIRAGIEIGNHSHSHDHFVNYPEKDRKDQFRDDLKIASDLFREHLGEAPEIYAYPYGEWTQDMEKVLEEEGFKAAAVQKSGVLCEMTPRFAIPRFPMGGPFATIEGFENKITMKALRIEQEIPDSPFYTSNPPELRVELVPGKINPKNAQFFVDGVKTEIKKISGGQQPYIILKAGKKLSGRRTLYTLTAPSADGKSWHWFSYLWINPEVEE